MAKRRHRRARHGRRRVIRARRRLQSAGFRMNPRRRRLHRVHRMRRRNPRRFGAARGTIKQMVVPALIGGAGAVGLDYLWGYFAPRLPAQLQTGYVGTAVKAGVAVGAGWLASKAIGKQAAAAGVVGALTVVAYQLLHQVIAGTATATAVVAAAPVATSAGVSAYMPRGRLGWVSPGSTLRGFAGARLGAYMPAMNRPIAPSTIARPGGGVSMSGLAYAGGT